MHFATIQQPDLASVIWPHRCVGCGKTIDDPNSAAEVPVKRALRCLFLSTPKTVFLPACAGCRRRVRAGRSFRRIGELEISLVLAGAVFAAVAFGRSGLNAGFYNGAGAALWVGCVLGWFGNRRADCKVRIRRTERTGWRFGFRDESTLDRFTNANNSRDGIPLSLNDPESLSPDNVAEQLLMEATDLEYRGNWEEAIGLYEQVIALKGRRQQECAQRCLAGIREKQRRAQDGER